ncbi:MAG: 30S ribosomal protein S6 [Candidatus Terrybacteria bacterium RIFCSPLOWO2_01_FULL_44_24]|uniref:Small ribosomal subunit protein bS6 n=1 Tax=Candidatus Terrybacteria bacterium RIFCSPHIGHO2_01_FULL_43_35 TaxID=1802361 RepID=A0A1G2PCV6_9BACT|nr:MAG: 30S ribosomal protein S6 [Candidatus Terrybacteria bacterium RIFCSPHIGHO2_01_FULL_43_35]OHA50451.1 MAG: 30S ribosomal protein S6 [Candidatus Terrybacteria bacterium RIFCSPHIGHO2_02_FULL_43_14]OHA51091.1 MAG: 30S ribosomal protein S6 [Candidatus Terrybacteria bacterium RIFCSPLOWO2_01_FULL_44_24]
MPDEQKTYELTCLIAPELDEDKYNSWLNRISSSITKRNGEMTTKAQMKEQLLAYPIGKKMRARLSVFKFMSPPSVPQELINEIRHEQDILRYLVIEIPKERKRPVRVKKPKLEDSASIQELDLNAPPQESKRGSLEEIDKRIEEILKSNP